jgi:hypothetical protein
MASTTAAPTHRCRRRRPIRPADSRCATIAATAAPASADRDRVRTSAMDIRATAARSQTVRPSIRRRNREKNER